MGIEPRHGNAGPAPQQGVQGAVGDAQRLGYVVRGHRVQRVAQRHVDAHQHRPQLVIGQHHAHRHPRHRHLGMPGSQRLQQFGMPGEGVVGGARRRQRQLVQRRGDQGGDVAAQGGLGRPHHAAPGQFTRLRTDLAERHQRHGRADLPDRNAAGRRLQCLVQAGQRQHRQSGQPGAGDAGTGTPHARHIPGHEAAGGGVGRIAKGLGDDLRADAGGVAQGDGNGWVHGGLRPGCRYR